MEGLVHAPAEDPQFVEEPQLVEVAEDPLVEGRIGIGSWALTPANTKTQIAP